MESNELAASIDYDEQLEAEFGQNVEQLPLAMSAGAMRPPAAEGSEFAALTDAELDAYLAEEDPAAAASSAVSASISTANANVCAGAPLMQNTKSAEAGMPEAPNKGATRNNDSKRQSSDSNSNDSQSARHAVVVPQVQEIAVSANNRHKDNIDEQEYMIEFEEPSEDTISYSGLAEHASQSAAASSTLSEPKVSDPSAQSSTREQVTTTYAAPAAVIHHSSGPASRRSSASNSVSGVNKIAPVGKATTMQKEQSWSRVEHHPAVGPGVHVASGHGSGSDTSVASAASALFHPSGLQDMQQLPSSRARANMEREPAAAAATALYTPWSPAKRSSAVEQRPASAALIKQDSASGRQMQQQLQQQQEEQQLIYAGSWQPSVAERLDKQHDLIPLPIAKWEVRDVCDWVENMGLPQYRKKFMHHCVDGNLLTRLTDELLKGDIGIGPLGHRYMLLEGVQALQAVDWTAGAAGIQSANCSATAAAAIAAAGAVAAAAAHRASSRHSSGAGGRSHAGVLIEVPSGTGSAAAAAAAVFEDVGGARSKPIRPSSAPCRGRGRSPSPQASSPAALGPTAGRISVYEQRAKILFELGRAQARAAAQSSTAAQLGDVARLAAEEVARLKGQLADLDSKNRLQVSSSSGSVDNRGQIPWQHVGAGTRAAHPHPESLAKPWDPPDADLTFKPRISKRSRQIMVEARGEGGVADFLDRLGNDLRRREVKMKELERRHWGAAAATPAAAAAAAKAAAAELSLVAGFLSQHGWADIPTGSSNGNDVGAQQELDEQLDEVVQSYRKELSLGDAQAQVILAARGSKKVSALASAVKRCQFMDRYRSDLSTRDSRLQELQEKWFKQQFVPGVPRPGSAVPVTQEQRDLAAATTWFKALGWDAAAEEDDCDDLLTALIKRACAYKAEAQKLHDKAVAAAAGAPANGQMATISQRPVIDWQSPPWSADGLQSRLQKMLDARRGAGSAPAAREAGAKQLSAAEKSLQAASKQQSVVGNTATAGLSISSSTNSSDPLEHAVQLLAGMRSASLKQLEAASGSNKKLAVYRALRTQSFLEFTAADLAARDAKQRAQWEAIEASRRGKQVSKQELDGFYKRLQEDGERRKMELAKAKADKADREAKALSLLKASTAASSARSIRTRPKSAACSVAR